MSGTGDVGFVGYQPVLKMESGNPEALKYGKMWEREEYRRVAPGEDLADLFLAQAHPRPGSSLIDFGCGTGRGGAALMERGKLHVTLVDFVNNCLDQKVRDLLTVWRLRSPNGVLLEGEYATEKEAVKASVRIIEGDAVELLGVPEPAASPRIRFVKADLEKPLPVVAEFGYCTDVMEHVPEVKVPNVLKSVLMAAQHVFFSISTQGDRCGELIGETLHLTTQKYGWWLRQFSALDCVVHWSRDLGSAVLFYVTAWPTAEEVLEGASINVSDEQIKANVEENCRGLKWAQVTPHPTNEVEVMILGGGPSLPEFEDEIKQKRADGVKLVTLNGAYNWALDHSLVPSATVLTDARPFNARFVSPVVPECKYMICSQCDPSVFEGLPEDRTLIWHTSAELTKDIVLKEYPIYWPVMGGSTSLLRAIPLLRMLGFKRFHLYGCDSCCAPSPALGRPGKDASAVMVDLLKEADSHVHHAYPQLENTARAYPVTCGGRTFWCQQWMVSQAQEFMNLIASVGDAFELQVHGDGLLAHILNTGARIDEERDEKIIAAEEGLQ